MTVSVVERPPLVGGRPYHEARCDQCEAAMSFAWHQSALNWRRKHEAECKGGSP